MNCSCYRDRNRRHNKSARRFTTLKASSCLESFHELLTGRFISFLLPTPYRSGMGGVLLGNVLTRCLFAAHRLNQHVSQHRLTRCHQQPQRIVLHAPVVLTSTREGGPRTRHTTAPRLLSHDRSERGHTLQTQHDVMQHPPNAQRVAMTLGPRSADSFSAKTTLSQLVPHSPPRQLRSPAITRCPLPANLPETFEWHPARETPPRGRTPPPS